MSDRFDVPWVGLLAITLFASVFAAFPQHFYELVVVSAVVGTGIPYAINILSFVGLRYYRDDVDPDFRAPGGYALPLVAFVALAFAMGALAADQIVWSLGALLPIVAYFGIRYWRNPEAFETPPDLEV